MRKLRIWCWTIHILWFFFQRSEVECLFIVPSSGRKEQSNCLVKINKTLIDMNTNNIFLFHVLCKIHTNTSRWNVERLNCLQLNVITNIWNIWNIYETNWNLCAHQIVTQFWSQLTILVTECLASLGILNQGITSNLYWHLNYVRNCIFYFWSIQE